AGNGISNAVFEIDKGIDRPQFRSQLLRRDEFAGRPEEDRQHLQRTPLDRQTHARTPQLSSREVQFECSEADRLTRILLHSGQFRCSKSTTSANRQGPAQRQAERTLRTLACSVPYAWTRI